MNLTQKYKRGLGSFLLSTMGMYILNVEKGCTMTELIKMKI